MENMLGLCWGTFQFARDLNGNACSGANNDRSGNSFYLFLFHSTARRGPGLREPARQLRVLVFGLV